MRKIWQLYIIFFIFFVFGDVGSTFMLIEEKQAVDAGEIEPSRPAECIPKVPAHCDRSIVMEKIGSGDVPLIWKIFALKLGIALSVLFLVFADHKITLLALTIISILITGNNLSILFFDLRNYFVFIEMLGTYFCIRYFARFREG